jgi:hypothetical protein
MNKRNLLIDFGLLAGFLLAIEPALTGIALHEWLAIGVAAVVVIHLLLHWKWIVNIGKEYFKKLFHSSRLKFLVDTLLFVSFTAIMMSGLMISKSVLPTLGIEVVKNHSWEMIHKLAANSTLALVGLHFALNWGWVVSMVKRYVISPVAGLFRVRRPVVVPVAVEINKK